MKDDSEIVASIIKHKACKLDGVANAIADPKLSKYLGEIADELITCSNDIEDNFMKKPAAPKLSPQDTDSTETVKPMADLSGDASGVDWQTGMIKPEVFNGSLPETD